MKAKTMLKGFLILLSVLICTIAFMPHRAPAISELRIGIGIDADTLNPQEQTTSLPMNMCELIYDTLLYQTPDAKLEPRLATRYEVSQDGLTLYHPSEKGCQV